LEGRSTLFGESRDLFPSVPGGKKVEPLSGGFDKGESLLRSDIGHDLLFITYDDYRLENEVPGKGSD